MKPNSKNNYLYYALFLLIISALAAVFWYSPVIFKGYTPEMMGEQIILGKNLAKTGIYALENDLNVLLSSNLIKEKAHPSAIGNKLTGYLYALVFKILGFLDWNNLILFSVLLNTATLLLFTLAVFSLFDFKTSIIFSLLYIFLPFHWWSAHFLGTYEFALFFLALFVFFYFLAEKKRANWFFLTFAGIFLALAGMAREVLFLVLPIFFIYLLLVNRKRQILFIFLPAFIILSVFYFPDFFKNHNTYLQYFPVKASEELKSNDFIFYGEFYPDPYTYHFDRENFLKEEYAARKSQNQGIIASLYARKLAVNINVEQMDILSRLVLSLLLLLDHLARFVSLEDMGGVFVFILIFLGLYFLKKNQMFLFRLSIFWILGFLFLLSFITLSGRDHLMDFGWIIAILGTMGILFLSSIIGNYFQFNKRQSFWLLSLILVVVLYSCFLGSRTRWGRAYDNKQNLMVQAYSAKICDFNISKNEVIAVGADNFFLPLAINYLTDKNLVVFQPKTIGKLLENGKIKDAFKTFGVKYILGYSNDFSEKLISSTGVINIASSDIEINSGELIGAKSWIMNLIK